MFIPNIVKISAAFETVYSPIFGSKIIVDFYEKNTYYVTNT